MGRTKRIRRKGASGVFLTEDRLIVTTMAGTPLGAKERDSFEVPAPDGQVAEVLKELVAEARIGARAVFGFDPRQLFTSVRRVTADDEGSTPTELVSNRLGNLEGGLVAAATTLKLPTGPHVRLIAAPRRVARQLLQGVEAMPGNNTRLVPVTLPLVQRAVAARKRPRKWRTLLRVIPGDDHGLVVLTLGDVPLAWRFFDCTSGELDRSLDVSVLGLLGFARDELGLPAAGGALIHTGEDDLYNAHFENDLGLEVELAPEVRLDGHTVSTALAREALRQNPVALDLFKELRPAGGIRENFPARSTGALTTVIAAAGLLMHTEAASLEADVSQIKARAKQAAASVGIKLTDLKGAHQRLEKEADIAHRFIANRVFWEEFLKEFPELAPRSMKVIRFDGRDVVRYKDKKKSGDTGSKNKMVSIMGEVVVAHGDLSPPEASELTAALQESELFQETFPRITGANIRLEPGKGETLAKILIMCLPGGA